MVLAACGRVDVDDLSAGRFEGVLHVVWLGEGEPEQGSSLFLYVPDPAAPLTFIRNNPDGSISRITPPPIYTDGGSIPRPITLFNGFSPWGYGPAYIIHDWLFIARHCLNDDRQDAVYQPYANVSFQESAEILAEAILALIAQNRVQNNDVALNAISGAVAGPISFARWNEEDLCDGHQVSDEDLASGNLGIPRPMALQTLRNLSLPTDVRPGQTVATFVF